MTAAKEIRVAHCFYDTYMGFAQKSLNAIVDRMNGEEDRGDDTVAIFINRKFSGVKVLYGRQTILYFKGAGDGSITPDLIKNLPLMVAGRPFTFNRVLEQAMERNFKSRYAEVEAERNSKLKSAREDQAASR